MAVALATGRYERGLFGRIRRDAKKSKSPNAGWPMAAGAWVAGAAMGGRAVYFGKPVEKPLLGPEGTIWDSGKMSFLRKSCLFASLGAAACLLLFRLAL